MRRLQLARNSDLAFTFLMLNAHSDSLHFETPHRERLEPRAQRRERLRVEGQARRGQQAALTRQAAVDPRDPASGLELDGGGGLALERDVRL